MNLKAKFALSIGLLSPLCFMMVAPGAHAGTLYVATFTCTGTCLSTPTVTDNPVSFTSEPTLDFTWDGISLAVTLSSGSLPTNTYEWVACPTAYTMSAPFPPGYCPNPLGATAPDNFNILDLTNDTGPYTAFPADECLGCSTTSFDTGTLTFTATPEPSTDGLMLIGTGLLLVMRKRIARSVL
jgi:hypothetical protein